MPFDASSSSINKVPVLRLTTAKPLWVSDADSAALHHQQHFAKPTNSTTFFITKNLLLPQILSLVLSKIYEKLYSSMAADGLTKALTPKAFQNFRSMMSM